MSPYADDKSFGVSSISRKRNILKLCNATRTPIIEVDNYRDLFLGPAPQPIKSIDSANSVLYIGSLTKSFMTTFRLGWIIGPKKVITKLADLRMQLEGGQNAVLQKIAEELISSGLYYDYLDNLNSQIRRDTPEITSLFEKYLTGIASWNLNPIGRSAYIRFIDDIDIHKMYENKGSFQFTPGYIMDNEWEQYVPISVITEPLELLAEGLSRLADLAKNSLR